MRKSQAVGLPALVILSGCFITSPAREKPEWRRFTLTPDSLGLVSETTSFRSRDSLRLRAWWLPAPSPRATVVLAHGSGYNRSGMLRRAAFLIRAGYNALAVDMRAHGESEGHYMSPGWLEADDLRAAVAWARSRDSLPVVVLGHSYGAVAALHVGTDTTLAAVIADAAFRDYFTMIDNATRSLENDTTVGWGAKFGIRLVSLPGISHAAGWMMRRQLGRNLPRDSIAASFAVKRLRVPAVLFIAGERDQIAPAADIRGMYDSASAPLKEVVVLAGATHSTFALASREQYEAAVLAFLERAISKRAVTRRASGKKQQHGGHGVN